MVTSLCNFNLIHHNTFAMPVHCARFVRYSVAADIPRILDALPAEMPVIHIGCGSNLLFTDDYAGSVLYSQIRYMRVLNETEHHVFLEVGAGVEMSLLISEVVERNWWGLENLAGIPGQVGAAAVQNVGAYGVEAGDCIDEVHAYDRRTRSFVRLSKRQCCFGYRESLFKSPSQRGRYIIHAVVFRLSIRPELHADYPALQAHLTNNPTAVASDVAKAVIAIRNEKLPDPAHVPSAGSYFKNPIVPCSVVKSIAAVEHCEPPFYTLSDGMVKIPAAWLIEHCGLKGFRLGNAAVWHLQPLVLTNPDRRAAPDDIIALERHIVRCVKDRYGITLIPEVEKI